MTDDSQLLRAYAAEDSEAAFRQLVERHISLVYSTALRVVCGDMALAQDVTQTVFSDLGRKARTLAPNVILSGWLYRHTTFTAAKALRGESRRRAREREAVAMNTPDESNTIWNQMEPLLDAAIGSLPERDRDALVMRFFDKQDFRAVAAKLDSTEDAAQKRVARALEKLRHYFECRGVTVSTVTLSGVIAAHSVSAAPATLATAIAGTALAHAGTAAATPLLISLFMANIKTIAVSAVLVAAATAPLLLQHNSISQLRAENQRLQQQIAAQAEAASAPAIAVAAQPDNRELLQLRAEVARLRREQAEIAKAQPKLAPAPATQTQAPAQRESVPSDTWTDRGFGSPMDTLQTAYWAVRNANVDKFKQSMMITDDARKKLHDAIAKMAAKADPAEAAKVLDQVARNGWDAEEGLLFPMIAQNQKHGYKSYRVLTENITQPDEHQITIQLEMNTAPAETRQFRFKQFGDAWKQVIDVADLPPEVRN